MMTIGLVACSKTKLDRPAPARELYTSPLFRAASAYAERTYDRWLILSALHGLVEPDQEIEPYDVTLTRMTVKERRAWCALVTNQPLAGELSGFVRAGGRIYLHAGQLYRAPFRPTGIVVPLEGLGIGRQLQWYAVAAMEAARTCGCGHPPHAAEQCGTPCELAGVAFACMCMLDERSGPYVDQEV